MGPRAAAGVQKSLIGCSIAIGGGLIGLFSRLSWFDGPTAMPSWMAGQVGSLLRGAAVGQARRAVRVLCLAVTAAREQTRLDAISHNRLLPPSSSSSRRLPANRLSAARACQAPYLLPTCSSSTNPNRRHPVSSQIVAGPRRSKTRTLSLPSWAQYGDGPWWRMATAAVNDVQYWERTVPPPPPPPGGSGPTKG
jgi:hypothetical protein